MGKDLCNGGWRRGLEPGTRKDLQSAVQTWWQRGREEKTVSTRNTNTVALSNQCMLYDTITAAEEEEQGCVRNSLAKRVCCLCFFLQSVPAIPPRVGTALPVWTAPGVIVSQVLREPAAGVSRLMPSLPAS